MQNLLKPLQNLITSRRTELLVAIVFIVSILESASGERFIREEMHSQVSGTLKYQAEQVYQSYEAFDQGSQILTAGVNNRNLQKQKAYGDFVGDVLVSCHRRYLSGDLSRQESEQLAAEIARTTWERIGIVGRIVPDASGHRNEMDALVRQTLLKSGESLEYMGKDLSDVYRQGRLGIRVRSALVPGNVTFGEVRYFEPFDWIVIYRDPSAVAGMDAMALMDSIKGSLERTISLISDLGNVVIQHDSGYNLYSGTFDSGDGVKQTRILYSDKENPESLLSMIAGKNDTFATLLMENPDGTKTERLCYILRDSARFQTIVVSRSVTEIEAEVRRLVRVSHLIGFINFLVICLVGYFLMRHETPQPEEQGEVTLP